MKWFSVVATLVSDSFACHVLVWILPLQLDMTGTAVRGVNSMAATFTAFVIRG